MCLLEGERVRVGIHSFWRVFLDELAVSLRYSLLNCSKSMIVWWILVEESVRVFISACCHACCRPRSVQSFCCLVSLHVRSVGLRPPPLLLLLYLSLSLSLSQWA